MKKLIQPMRSLALGSLALACAACGPDATEPATVNSDSASESAQPSTMPDESAAVSAQDWDRQVAAAIADLAARNGIEPESITVRSARTVTWSDSALGCPEPDMSYTEVLQHGLQVLLEADGAVYFYHGKDGAELFYCPKDRARAPAYGPGGEIM